MLVLRQSTSIDIRMGPFVDVTDGVTPETGITIGAADQAEVLKDNGAATVAMTGTLAAVTGADGWYDYTVQTGDVDTVGEVVFVLQDSSECLPVHVRGYVVEEAVYDALYEAGAAIHTAELSDIESSLVIVKSDLVVVSSDTTVIEAAASDIESSLVIVKSDLVVIESDTTVIEAAGGGLTAGQASQLTQVTSDAIVLTGMVSDVESSLVIVKSDLVVVESDTTVLEAGVNVTQYDGVSLSFTGQIQAVAADTPSAGVTRITIQDPSLDSDADDQLIASAFYLVDRSQQKVIAAQSIGDYDGTNFYVFVDDPAVTPTTGMDYLIAFVPRGSPTAGPVPSVDATHIGGTAQTGKDVGSGVVVIQSQTTAIESDAAVIEAAASDIESSLVIVKSDLVVISSDTTAIEAGGGSLTAAQASQLSQVHSDVIVVYSDTTAIEAGGGSLTVAQASQLTQVTSDAIVLTSMVSDVESSLVIVRSDLVVVESDTTVLEAAASDIESSLVIVKSDLVVVDAAVSDVESSLVIVKSDLVVATSDTAAIHSQTTVIESDVAQLDSAHAEPTGVPAANASPLDKLGVLYAALRNRVDVTATKKTFYDDGGSAEWEKDLSDNGTTYTETEGNAV